MFILLVAKCLYGCECERVHGELVGGRLRVTGLNELGILERYVRRHPRQRRSGQAKVHGTPSSTGSGSSTSCQR